MAIETTGIMRQQLMQSPTNIAPQTPMDGTVTRTSMARDLISAMNDIDFRQLVEQYAAISGQSVATSRPLTNQMMQNQNNNLGGDVMQGEARTPILNPNQMPSLQGTYSNMPVIPNNFNNAPGIDDAQRENMGLMQPQPMGA
tara:strand:- start:3167 stop:3592 length:426 start_codon:yes stop_codon:yes gene_type:complete